MNPLIKHIHAVKDLQMTALVIRKSLKVCFRLRIYRTYMVHPRLTVNPSEPLVSFCYHLVHMIHSRTEHDDFSISSGHMLLKDNIHPVCLLQCAANLFIDKLISNDFNCFKSLIKRHFSVNSQNRCVNGSRFSFFGKIADSHKGLNCFC